MDMKRSISMNNETKDDIIAQMREDASKALED